MNIINSIKNKFPKVTFFQAWHSKVNSLDTAALFLVWNKASQITDLDNSNYSDFADLKILLFNYVSTK